MNSDKLLAVAIESAKKAGIEVAKHYKSGDYTSEMKADNSPVTSADLASNDVLMQELSRLTPDIPVISEEVGTLPLAERKKWSRYWLLDPIDGTGEFIKGSGDFAVNIALVENRKPTLGVIYAPFLKVLYVGDVKKKEAFKVFVDNFKDFTIDNIRKNFKPIRPDDSSKNSVKVVGSRSHMNKETEEFIEKLNKTGYDTSIVSKGSSLKFCLVAEGAANVYPRFAPTMEWDTAAGQAICNAVGIDVISQETNKPLEYNKENLLNPWFLVGNHENV